MGKRVLGISIALLLVFSIGVVITFAARAPLSTTQIGDAAVGVVSEAPWIEKSTPISSLDELTWTTKRAMPTARYGAITGYYSNLLFVAGGAQDTTHPFNTGVVEVYNPASDTWSQLYTANPNPRRMAGSGQVQVGQYLYVIGGITEAGVVSGQGDYYDMATDVWSTVANDCESRYAHGIAAVGTDIYVFGGTDGVAPLASGQKLNTLNGTWSDIADLPDADGWMAGAASGGKVYAFGGANYPSRVLEYDPAGNTWTQLANMPISRVYATAVGSGGRIYLAGGESAASGGVARLNVYSFTPSSGLWTNEGALPASRVWPALGTSDTDAFVIGGLDGTEMPVTFTSTCWQAPLPLADLPGPVTSLQATVYNDPFGALIEWVNPEVNDVGDPLTDLDSVCVVRYSCTDTLGTLLTCLTSPTIGGAARYMDADIMAMGAYQWEVTPYNTTGAGEARYVSGFIGTEGAYTYDAVDYDWTDISVIGDPVAIDEEDEVAVGLPLGFTFNFYGGNYTAINVSENGWLSFTSTGGYYMNSCLPATGEPNNAIYPFFDDLSIPTGGDIYEYQGDSEFIVQWDDVGFYDASGTAKFQVVIRADGTIDFVYYAVFSGPMNSATVGIEDATGANYLQLCCNGAGTACPAPGTAYRLNVACLGDGSIRGTVVLDPSYGGDVEDVTITTDMGDVTSPAADGQYTLAGVRAGTHTLTASLADFDDDVVMLTLMPYEEITGVDFSLVRSAPSQVGGLWGAWSYATGCVEMSWTALTDTTVHEYCVYKTDAGGSTFTLDTCISSEMDFHYDCFTEPVGVYQYYITAKDNGPSTPQESIPSEILQVSVGPLPPFWLTGSGYSDTRITLDWFGPDDSAIQEFYYDDGTNEAGGLGFGDHGYYAVRFTFDGPVTIYGLRFYWTDQAVPSSHNELYVWEADAGAPGTVALEMSSNQAGGANAFVDYELATPLEITSGDFFVGASQTSVIDYLGLGGDDNSESFVNGTYFYSISGSPGDWATFESAMFYYTPMIRVLAAGEGGPAIAVVGDDWHQSQMASESGKDAASGAVLWLAAPTMSRGAVEQPVPTGDFEAALRYPRYAPAKSSWIGSSDKIGTGHLDEADSYYIYRDSPDQVYHVTPAESTMFIDYVSEGVLHCYWVTAYYAGEPDSESTPTDSCCIAANMPPGPVQSVGVWFTDVPACSVTFTWTAPTVNADGTPLVDLEQYRIYRDGETVTDVASDILTYSEYVPDAGEPHVYGISAMDEVPNAGTPVEVNVLCEAMCNYEWVELQGDPNAVEITGVGDDSNLGPYSIGFPFEFYGEDFTEFRFASNGFITFESTSGSYANDSIPTAAQPNGAIYALWDDLDPTEGGTFWYKYDAAEGRLIVEWKDVPYVSLAGTATFEIILYNYGGIQFQYNDVDYFEGATIGVENQDGTDGVLYCYNGDGNFCQRNGGCVCTGCVIPGHLEGLVRRYPDGAPIAGALVEVLSTGQSDVSGADGSYEILNIPCGNQAVKASADGYCDGLDTVEVACYATTTKNFGLRVPRIQVDPDPVVVSCHNQTTCIDSFYISNQGGRCDLDFSIEIEGADSWLEVDPVSGSVAQDESLPVYVTFTPDTAASDLDALIRIYHNAADSPYLLFVELNNLATGIRQVGIPAEFALHQNFPNPFNPVTTIHFDLPTREHVRLEIFNVIGQKVRTLVDEPMVPGYHMARFDASQLPSGLYFYRLEAGSYAALKKMMLIK